MGAYVGGDYQGWPVDREIPQPEFNENLENEYKELFDNLDSTAELFAQSDPEKLNYLIYRITGTLSAAYLQCKAKFGAD